MNGRADRYWQQYLGSLPAGAPRPASCIGAGGFGFTPQDASEIAPRSR